MSMSIEGVVEGESINDSAPPSAPPSAPSSAPSSTPVSPKSKIKFLCSHGGKILPRPADGHLKYVGGETRVISVHRDIVFQELMKKLTYAMDGEMILKYQLVPEDIDTLVSVKTDEDLKHMFEEHDRYEKAGSARLRAFLFPKNPIVVDNGSTEHHALEQRYIDAINGFVRPPTTNTKKRPTLNLASGSHGFGFSSHSACSSPRSPESCISDINHDIGRKRIQKVRSSPSLCSLDKQQQGSPRSHQYSNHYQHYRQLPTNHSNQFIKPPIDPHRGGVGLERMFSLRSVGRSESLRYQVDHTPQHYYPPSIRHSRGSGGGYLKSMHYDDNGHYIDRRMERAGSVPVTPVPLSPRRSHINVRGWESPLSMDH